MFYIIYVIDQCFSDVLNQDGPYNVTTSKYDLAITVQKTKQKPFQKVVST